MRYNREQLKAMGMDEKQINAIMATYDAAVSAQTAEDNAVATPLKVHSEAILYDGTASAAYSRAVPDHVLPVMDETEAMKVTSIADLHVYGQGKVVRFPDFAETATESPLRFASLFRSVRSVFPLSGIPVFFSRVVSDIFASLA